MGYCRVNSEKTDRRIFARKRFEDKQKHKFYFSGKGSRASDPFRARAKSHLFLYWRVVIDTY